MSNVQILNFHDLNVRTDIENDTIWFCAKDVCDILGYDNPWKAVKDHIHNDDLTKREVIDSMGRTQKANFVNESGMYALIFGSKLDSAKEFKRWVTSEVLPQIRKTGQYAVPKIDKSLSYVKKLDVIKQSLPSEVGAVLDEIVDKAKKQGYCVANKGHGKVKLNMRLTPEDRLLNIGLEMMDESERQNLNKTVELVKEIGAVKGRAQMLDKYEGTEKFLTVLNMYEKELREHTIKALDKGECPPILPFICSYIHNSKSELM